MNEGLDTRIMRSVLYLDFLLEEYSAEVALNNILPRILPEEVTFRLISFQGKADLLKKLPQRLKAYSKWLPNNYGIVVLCDKDSNDCIDLKNQLDEIALDSGLRPKTFSLNEPFNILNRIAIEELESWLIGDPMAINQTYPKIPESFSKRKRFRAPDKISGGTWEALEALLKGKGYYRNGLNKVQVARDISTHMDIQRNTSESFNCFVSGIQAFFR